MTAVAPKPIATTPYPARESKRGSFVVRMLRTTDPKDIAILYLVTSFGFFLIGGLMALLMRAELARPGLQILSVDQYNQLFTMHGTIMLLLYATPILFGFANYIVPLQIGAPEHHPRTRRGPADRVVDGPSLIVLVELRGLEPLTLTLPV